MVMIARENQVVTLINVFRVKPENQQALVDLLIEATEQIIRHLPGFISASIHRGFDGTRVINYAQWRAREDFAAMLQLDGAKPHLQRTAALAEDFDPMLCEVVDSIAQPG